MEPSTAVVALDGNRACNMLHSKVITDGSRTVTNEITCLNKSTTRKQVMEEVVQCSLVKAVSTKTG